MRTADLRTGRGVLVGSVIVGTALACLTMVGCFADPTAEGLLPDWLDNPGGSYSVPAGAGDGGAGNVSGPLAGAVLPGGRYEPASDTVDDPGQSESDTSTGPIALEPTVEFMLALTVTGEGRTEPAPGVSVHSAHGTVVLEAVPSDGFWFAGWSGDVDGKASTITIVMNGDKSVVAEFRPFAPDAGLRFHLPWAAGCTYTVGQGNNGSFSHAGLFAWDIPMPIGTPVVAAGAVVNKDVPPDTLAVGVPARHYPLGESVAGGNLPELLLPQTDLWGAQSDESWREERQ